MAYTDVRPAGYDVAFRPGNTLTVTLEWPTGELTGRTFSATLDGVPLTVEVVNDVMTVAASADQTAVVTGGPVDWLLLESISSQDEPIIVGTWSPSDRAAVTPPEPVQVTQGASEVTVTVASAQASVVGLAARVSKLERDPFVGVRPFWERLAWSRLGGQQASVVFLGDSLTESYEPSKRGYRWGDIVSRRLSGRFGMGSYIPAAANTFSSRSAVDWPGGVIPWTYTGTTAGDVTRGMDLHTTVMSANATATISYYGDIAAVLYTKTTSAATSVTVTLDGTSVTAISPNGTEVNGQAATYGTIGDYGFHTLVLTVGSDGNFHLEGLSVSDNIRFGFGIPFDAVRCTIAGHAGFAVPHFTANSKWATSLVTQSPHLVVIALGTNDQALNPGSGGTPSEFRTGLVTMMEMIDTAATTAGGAIPDYLLMQMPGHPVAWVDAAWDAAEDFDSDRCSVLDLATAASSSSGLLSVLIAGNGHPNDGGQRWIADRVLQTLDPLGAGITTYSDAYEVRIDARTPPLRRSSWTESISYNSGVALDTSGGGTTVGERRHRVWLEAGTWQAHVLYRQNTSLGTIQVLTRGVSHGTQSTAGTDSIVGAALGTQVTIDSPGWYPVTIRKTTTTGAINFGSLTLRRTA